MLREALSADQILAMEPSEAAAHFYTLMLEGLNSAERAVFDEWLAADDRNVQAFNRVEQAWASFADADDNEILEGMRTHALRPMRRRWADWRRLAAVAACLLIIVASASLIGIGDFWRPKNRPGIPAAEVQYASLRGEVKTIVLADGSELTLDGDSRAVARFTSDQRSVELVSGRALFVLKRDPARPFSVNVADRRIADIGTAFDVTRTARGMSVAVLSGRVLVSPIEGRGQTVELGTGQKFTEHDGRGQILTDSLQSTSAASWRSGLLQFDGETLADAAAEINRHSRKRLIIADPSIGSIKISGQFKAGDADRFADTVSELYPVHVVDTKNEITLSRR